MEAITPPYKIVPGAQPEYADSLVAELRKFNQDKVSPLWAAPPQSAGSIQFVVLDPNEMLIGGVLGRTHQIPEWLEITVVWVAESWRGKGLGRELMQLAEEEAKRRGCIFARLATGDYQTPDFYRKLGYQEYGKLENCPRGETVYYFFKELG